MFLEESFPTVERVDEEVAYIDYSPESLVANLKGIAKLSKVEQIAYISKLSQILEQIKEKSVELLPELIVFVKEQDDVLIEKMLGQVVPVSDLLAKDCGQEGYNIIVKQICPFLKEHIFSKDADIRVYSRSRLGEIASLLTEDDRNFQILPVCLNLVHDITDNDNKVAGLKLLGQLAPLFTKEFIEGYITSELIALSQDPFTNVRSQSISQMANIGTHIDQETIISKFLPEFDRLSKDKEWQVRQMFVENSVALANYLPVELRGREFGGIFLRFINDKTRWVKESSLKELGHILSLLNSENMNQKLFAEYLKIPKTIEKMNQQTKTMIGLSCASTLPRVIKAYGHASWDSLKGLYKLLLTQDDIVKAELAKSLHLLAKNVSKKIAQTDLLAVMNSFIQSNSYLVKQEAIKGLAVFLEAIDKDKREKMADVYATLQSDPNKWRIRDIIAGQIDILSRLFSPETFNMLILPQIFKLCRDTVAKVREKACSQIWYLIKNKKDDEYAIFMILEQMKSFAEFKRFTWRQAFVLMCDGIIDMPEFFKEHLMSYFIKLASDKVINVRIAMARILHKHRTLKSEIIQLAEIQAIIEILKHDEHVDVRKIMLGQEFVESQHGRERSVRSSELTETIKENSSFVSVIPEEIAENFSDTSFQSAFDEITENKQNTSSESFTEVNDESEKVEVTKNHHVEAQNQDVVSDEIVEESNLQAESNEDKIGNKVDPSDKTTDVESLVTAVTLEKEAVQNVHEETVHEMNENQEEKQDIQVTGISHQNQEDVIVPQVETTQLELENINQQEPSQKNPLENQTLETELLGNIIDEHVADENQDSGSQENHTETLSVVQEKEDEFKGDNLDEVTTPKTPEEIETEVETLSQPVNLNDDSQADQNDDVLAQTNEEVTKSVEEVSDQEVQPNTDSIPEKADS